MTTNDTTQTYSFKTKTYGGISVIFETNTGYFNASRMCSDNNKKWRAFKQSKAWHECLEICNEFIGSKVSAQNWTDGKVSFEPGKVANEFRGEYVHPKLIHFVAEYCSRIYAFKVSELMDSINKSVHKQLEQQQLEDNVENSKKLFISTCETIIDVVSNHDISDVNEAFENQFSWGVRDSPKSDSQSYYDVNNAINCLYSNKARLSGNSKYTPILNAIDEASKREIRQLEKGKLTQAKKDRLEFLLTAEYKFELERLKLHDFKDNDADYNKKLVEDLNSKYKEEHKFNVKEFKLIE